MQTFFRIYYALTLLGTFTSVLICLRLWRMRNRGLGTASFLMMLAVTLWLVPTILQWLFEDLAGSIWMYKLGYIGAFFLPAAWFIYALHFVRKEAWASAGLMRALTAFTGFLLVLVFTDQYWTEIRLVQDGSMSYLKVSFSPWLNLAVVYSYALIGIGTILIITAIVRWPRVYWRGGLVLLVGFLAPLASNVIFLLDLIPSLPLDFTPLSFLFSSLVLIWGGFRYQLFDVVPVAREALVDVISDGMLVVDTAGLVLDLNPAARQLLGKSTAQARRKPLPELLPEMTPLLPGCGQPATEKSELAVERNGKTAHYEVLLTPIHNRDGLAAGALITLHDITGRKQAELQLQEALDKEKALVETKSRFVAVASHAFRTPLTTIASSAQFLETYYDRLGAQKRKDHLARIRQSVNGLVALIKRMLTIEEIQSGKLQAEPTAFDLLELCQQAVRDLTSHPDRPSIHIEHHGRTFMAVQDKVLLYQVLTNLLSNAFKYSPPESTVWLSLVVEGESVRITVRDEGIGIPAADLPHLGEAFYRGANANSLPGSGLGLLIVKQALRLMGGTLQVESVEGQGACMQATFPLRLVSAPAEN